MKTWPAKPEPDAEIVERGFLPCRTCGKVHHARRVPGWWGSWADPEDGHVYNSYSWEEIGRKLVDDYAVDLERLART